MFIITNKVYFNDDSGELYGYVLRLKSDRTKRTKVSSTTVHRLNKEGKIHNGTSILELSYCTVPRDYKEDLSSLEKSLATEMPVNQEK